MASRRERRYPDQQHVPVAGSGTAGQTACDARAGRRVHVFDAEDDLHAVCRPAPGADEPYDALDDAADVRLLHHDVPQRTGAVLGRVQHRGDDNTGLRNWVGPSYRYAEIQA